MQAVHCDPPAPHSAAPMAEPDAPQAEYLPFEQALAGLMGSGQGWREQLASPGLARAWAQVLVQHWSRLQRLGALDTSQPIFVLDLSPGHGELASLLLPALDEEMHAHGMQTWPVRVLACFASREQQAQAWPAWQAAPGLGAWHEAARLSPALQPAQCGQPLVVGAAKLPLFGSRNPVAAVALGGWSNQADAQFAVSQGQLFQGLVRLLPSPGEAGLELGYHWLPCEEPADTEQALLLQRYRAGVPHAPLRLSAIALAQGEWLHSFSGSRWLLLAADAGVADEQAIRLHALAPPATAEPGELLLPVNFDALARHQRGLGARVAQLALQEGGTVLHLACSEVLCPVDERTWRHWHELALRHHPDDRRPLPLRQPGHAAELAGPERMLRHAHADAALLPELLASLAGQPLSADRLATAAMGRQLQRAWSLVPAAHRVAALGLPLADLAMRLGLWALARQVLRELRAATAQERCAVLACRAQVELATGHTTAALPLAQRALLAQAAEPVQQLAEHLRARLAHWLAHPWYLAEHLREGPLCLELLDESHDSALQWQLRDPGIAQMAQLDDTDGACADSVEYALMHECHGLVGVLGFRPQGDSAQVHLWTGTDHQGRGLATAGMALLLRVLEAAGITQATATVFASNQRCLRLLQRLGFVQVGDPAHEHTPQAQALVQLRRGMA